MYIFTFSKSEELLIFDATDLQNEGTIIFENTFLCFTCFRLGLSI